jgi:beta-glucosidase
MSPEGRLPISFERTWEDNPVHDSYYPNVLGTGHETDVKFLERLMLGYRYYTTAHKLPLFPFGFGLSYTTFSYSNLTISARETSISALAAKGVIVSVVLKNTGGLEGAEVAQLYISDPSAEAERPERELKAFQKVRLRARESRHVTFVLDARAFSYFDALAHDWRIDPGRFRILVGPASDRTPLQGDIHVVR